MSRILQHICLFIGISFCTPVYCFAQAETVPPPEAALPDIVGGPGRDANIPLDKISLFFTLDQISALSRAKNIYGRQGLGDDDIYDEQDLLRQLRNIKLPNQQTSKLVVEKKDKEQYFTQFYLQSIAYHGDNDWTIWLLSNKQKKKIVSNNKIDLDGLKISAIGKEEAEFEWDPPNWTRVEKAYSPDEKRITLDEKNHLVHFTLHTNETLSSQSMTIMQGQQTLVPRPGFDPKQGTTTNKDGKIVDIFGGGAKNAAKDAATSTPTKNLRPAPLKNYKDLDREMQP